MKDLKDWEGELPVETNEEYHARPELSSSQLKVAGESGVHYKHKVIDGNQESTWALEFGTLCHEYIFEGRHEEYIGMPNFRPTKIDGKKVTMKSQVDTFLALHFDKKIIEYKDFVKVSGMKAAFDADPLAQSLLAKDDLIEQGYRYYDEDSEVHCRFKPDRLNRRLGHMIDYKTTTAAAPWKFKWDIKKFGYHISAAHYMVGADRLMPGEINKFIFIAQEKKPPYACGVYFLHDIDLAYGAESRRLLLARILSWGNAGVYPSYTTKLSPITLPNYGDELQESEDEEFAAIDF